MSIVDESRHVVPQNLESEEQVIGCLLIAPSTIEICDANGFRETDFYRHSHRIIYAVIRELAEKGAYDEMSVINQLRAQRTLTKAGGQTHIITLADRVLAVASAKAHIEEVIDQAKLRSLVETGHEIARLGYEHPDKIKTLYSRSQILMDSAAKNADRTPGEKGDAGTLAEWTVNLMYGNNPTVDKWALPLPTLQESTGGFSRGQLVSIGALPGDGKSAFRNQIVLGLDPTTRIGVLDLEMDRHDGQVRMVSSLTGISTGRIWDHTQLNDVERMAVIEAAETLGERCYEIHQGNKTIEMICAVQKRERYDVLVIDHFHKIPGVEEIKVNARVASRLADLAMETNCAVILMFQLNQDKERGFPIPTVNRVKGGMAILENSDIMLFIHRYRNKDMYPTLEGQIIAAKVRGGAAGYGIDVSFNPSRLLFTETVPAA